MAPFRASLMMFFLSSLTLPSSLFLFSSSTSILLSWHMLSISSSHISFSMILDPQGLLFMSVIMFISGNVLMFSKSYMKEDNNITRFTHLTLLFVLSMNMLVLFPHLMILLLGWDGLGITSFLLIIYYQNPKSLAAGMFTALTNRIGDVLILISIAWLLQNGNWIIINVWMNEMSLLIIVFLTIAGMTKSAQIPFSSWLPAAMEAPTPVSALVHSSTLVTGGIFLLIRFFPFLNQLQFFNLFLLIMASLTMLMAGLSAMNEMDMKKVIALSTLSQLGLMMMSLALGMPTLTLFHLLTHALFKALLFMAAGSIILYASHNQDLRLMGLSAPSIPMTSTSMLIANMALFGAPFLAGFYSKDLILEEILFNQSNSLVYLIAFFATGLTAGYSLRMMMLILWSPKHSIPCSNLTDKDYPIVIPMLLMTLAAIIGGSALNWMLISPSQPLIIPFPQKILTPMIILLGMSTAWFFTNPNLTPMFIKAPMTLNASSSMWFLTNLSTQNMISVPLMTSHVLSSTGENGWMELSSGQGTKSALSSISSKIQSSQSKTMNKLLLMSIFSIIPMMILF
uniref:NADH-ubiquinone oxidoreductase chain 5 n=1 Tax=Paraescarpia echinospica TaxID=2080241 RepID=A0A343TEX3_9ANNE|nr:NADH dehydrogenase subunit 5 [Paraescarpia echinospica]AUW55448.1 NADH dehydrogenase subunit 5 [Paraescarpia echinospica]